MSENNYAALMMKRAPTNSESWNNIKDPGIYPIAAGHPSAPDGAAGVLFVMPPKSGATQDFISTSKKRYTRTFNNGAWLAWSAGMFVGDFGLGVGPQHKADAFSDVAQIYRINASSASSPGGSVYGVICLPCDGAPSAAYLAAGNNGELYVGRSTTASKGVLWNRVYTTAYKPTAADVGAVASLNGVASRLKVTDELTINDNVKLYRDGGKFLFEARYDNGTEPAYYSFSPGDGTFRAGRGYFDTDIRIAGETIRIYKEDTGLWFNVSGRYFWFQNDGVFKADSVFENNLRVYSPNNPQPPNLEWQKVGSYAFAMYGGNGNINFNEVVSGSNLYPSGAAGSAGGATLAGSWRCMGISTTVNDAYRSTLWMRIS
ncbi:hypothetical protein N1I02_001158 [Serratia marcescens]